MTLMSFVEIIKLQISHGNATISKKKSKTNIRIINPLMFRSCDNYIRKNHFHQRCFLINYFSFDFYF